MKLTRYQGRYIRLVEDGGWEFVERVGTTGVVVIVAVTAGGELLLVEQRRVAVGTTVIELPAGLAGDVQGAEDEALEAAAQRELIEETGFAAASWERLTSGPVSAGLCAEVVTFFRARGLQRVGAGGGDDSEDIAVHRVPLDAVSTFLTAAEARGAVVDPKVFAGLWFTRG